MKNKLIIKTLSNIFSKLGDCTKSDIFDKDENFTSYIPNILGDLELCVDLLELENKKQIRDSGSALEFIESRDAESEYWTNKHTGECYIVPIDIHRHFNLKQKI